MREELRLERERSERLRTALDKAGEWIAAVDPKMPMPGTGDSQQEVLDIISAALAPAQPEVTPDFDCAHEPGECLGHCRVCGLEFEEGCTHECPPGFRTAQPEEPPIVHICKTCSTCGSPHLHSVHRPTAAQPEEPKP